MTQAEKAESLRVASVQSDIVWENKEANFSKIEAFIRQAQEKAVDLLLFPEMMTTGFSDNFSQIAEPAQGTTFLQLKEWSMKYQIALATTFVIQEENGKLYNRGYFFRPDGSIDFQDKRHLFRMGGEAKQICPAEKRNIFSYKGWNFFMPICYDLRFPVWCRNVKNEYDVILATANWPEARAKVWETLQIARAMENLSFVVGANRIGVDFSGLNHTGNSFIVNARGEILAKAQANEEKMLVAELTYSSLTKLRTKFPVWMDQDTFEIIMESN